MTGRKSTITNAFVNAIIPAVNPSAEEINEALRHLELDPDHLRCSYCGGACTEWDHLRPLVVKMRPTGYISEIANLVPACSKCNQSKRNQDWREWMLSKSKHSPTGRGLADVPARIDRLEHFTQWRAPTRIDFERWLGEDRWKSYWRHWEKCNEELATAQRFADQLKSEIATRLQEAARTDA